MVRWEESVAAVAQECGGGQARIGEGLGRGLWVHGRPHTKWSTPLNRGGWFSWVGGTCCALSGAGCRSPATPTLGPPHSSEGP